MRHTSWWARETRGATSTVQTANGYNELSVGLRTDAAHQNKLEVQWFFDAAGTILYGTDTVMASGSRDYGVGRTTVKAPYFKVKVFNEDAALAHTMSTQAYLLTYGGTASMAHIIPDPAPQVPAVVPTPPN